MFTITYNPALKGWVILKDDKPWGPFVYLSEWDALGDIEVVYPEAARELEMVLMQ